MKDLIAAIDAAIAKAAKETRDAQNQKSDNFPPLWEAGIALHRARHHVANLK